MADAGEQLARVAVREHMASTQKELQRQAAEEANHELETKNHELEERATRDALTGLYNRTYFADALNAAIIASARAASPIGVVFCDIDHFKILNDTYGHQFGDDVLRHVAQIFYEVLRKSDVIARYGGEEFVVLVHQPTEKGLEKLSERLRQAIESGGSGSRENASSSPSASERPSSCRNATRVISRCDLSRPPMKPCTSRSRTAAIRSTFAR